MPPSLPGMARAIFCISYVLFRLSQCAPGMAIEVYTGHGWLSSGQSWVDIAEFSCNLNVFLRSFHDVSRPNSVLHQCLVEIAVAHSVVQTHLLAKFFKSSFMAFSCGQLSRWSCTRDVSSASDQLRNFFKFSRTICWFHRWVSAMAKLQINFARLVI